MRKIMPFLAIIFSLALPVIAKANDQIPYKTVVFISGKCENLTLANEVKDCSTSKSIVYDILKNGKVLLSIPFEQNKMATFVAQSDSQPNAETYNMYLSKIDIDSKTTHSESKLEGVCHISLSADGQLWHSVSCQAKDTTGTPYMFHFTGGSKPVDVIHP